MARLLILWVDESLEDRARSLSAERLGLLRVSRRSEVRPLESRPMMRAPEAANRLVERQLAAGVARESCNSLTTVRIAYQRNSSFLSDRLARD